MRAATQDTLPGIGLTADEQFFYDHAGYAHPVGADEATQESARVASAVAYAKAERLGRDVLSVTWEIDDIDSSEFDTDDDGPPYELWVCLMRHTVTGEYHALGGIDFGRTGNPDSDPYRRVVEAELAWEALDLPTVN